MILLRLILPHLLGAVCIAGLLYSSHMLALEINFLKKDPLLEVSVLDPFAPLRTGPSRGYPIFHVVEKGDKITVIKRRTDWYKVKTQNGKYGWVKQSSLENTLAPDGHHLSFSVPDWENYIDRRWEMGVMAGNFSSAKSFTSYIGYHFTRHIAAEANFTQSFGRVSSAKLGSINLTHQTFPDLRVSPFVTLGTGILSVSPRSSLVQVEDREDTILTVGGGVMIYITRRLLLRLEYDNHTVLTTRENNDEVDEWKAGFSVFF